MPISTMAMPLNIDPEAMVEAATRPSTISPKYSADPNLSAEAAIIGEKPISAMIPTVPPKKLATVVMNSAVPARPFCAIG